MSRINGLSFAFVAIAMLFICHVASAADEVTPAPVLNVTCKDAKAATVNATLLKGEWFEAARKPIDSNHVNEQCVKMDLSYNGTAIFAQVTFNNNPDNLSQNQTVNHTMLYTVKPELVEGIYNYQVNGTTITYKVLETDYVNFAFLCGYVSEIKEVTTPAPTTTVAPKPNSKMVQLDSTGAFILTREREVNATFMTTLSTNATRGFADFNNLQTVIQSSKCNGAGSLVPALSMILAFVVSMVLRH